MLIITGTMAAGKTTVLAEASDILAVRHNTHVAIDLDALGLAHLPSAASNDGVIYLNLQSVCKNYASHGVKRLLLGRAMEDRAGLAMCRGVVSATNMVVCRLSASIETLLLRVKTRELGVSQRDILQREYLARVAELSVILDRARLEDFTITSENPSSTDLAHETLVKAGWI